MDGGGLGHRPACAVRREDAVRRRTSGMDDAGTRSWSKWVIGIGQPQGLRRGEELARLVLAGIG
jgi:hypothetical protein